MLFLDSADYMVHIMSMLLSNVSRKIATSINATKMRTAGIAQCAGR
jgi:hypothetical protein